MEPLTLEEVRFRLHYDPDTGVFTWLNPNMPSRAKQGGVAGTKTKPGYWMICINRHHIFAHRLAWFYMTGEWPKAEVDHRDCDPSNNAWSNLRDVSSGLNGRNTRIRKDNTTGFKCVAYNKRKRKYFSYIRHEGRLQFLGYFSTPEAAHAVYAKTAVALYGEYARTA